MSTTRYLAVDLGAESGRVMLGTLAEGRLALEEIHRFPNRVLTLEGHLHWDLPHLEREIFAGIDRAAQRELPIAAISADSWGVDYVLLDAQGAVVAPPFCYRDARNADSSARLVKRLTFSTIYKETGIQFLPFNTLFQLEAEERDPASPLRQAACFLPIADYFNARLSGREVVDQSMASTTQIYNPRTRDWSAPLIAALGLPASLFPRIVPSGTALGPLTKDWRGRPALASAQVVASCSHDTGAAVAAVPARDGKKWAYLSSGTWSLLGVELPSPVLTDEAREAGFTNEVGIGGSIRFLKNIAGLWVLQECRRAWEADGQTFTYDQLMELAAAEKAVPAQLALDDPRFVSAGDMPAKITAFCRETGQPAPSSPGQFVRVILQSLARTYAKTLAQLESLAGHKIETLHVVGGGSRSALLNQLTADATGLPVVAGPVEATAVGNILIQALALGHLASAADLRRVVEASFPTQTFNPTPTR